MTAAGHEADSLDSLVLHLTRRDRQDYLRRISILRRHLALLHGQVISKGRVTAEVQKAERFSEHTRTFIRDVEDHINIMVAEVGIVKDLVSSVETTYLAKCSLDQADASDRVNEVMKRFSAVATVFVPLSLVAGIMGMNVQVPFQNNYYHSYWPFISIVLGMLIVACSVLALFKKAKWL